MAVGAMRRRTWRERKTRSVFETTCWMACCWFACAVSYFSDSRDEKQRKEGWETVSVVGVYSTDAGFLVQGYPGSRLVSGL